MPWIAPRRLRNLLAPPVTVTPAAPGIEIERDLEVPVRDGPSCA
jgi:hypothetical protein